LFVFTGESDRRPVNRRSRKLQVPPEIPASGVREVCRQNKGLREEFIRRKMTLCVGFSGIIGWLCRQCDVTALILMYDVTLKKLTFCNHCNIGKRLDFNLARA
jgi:hypothetical protein